ncbi:hypothetical protein PANDA_012598, partial [Ailuropoda melanoleuca]
WLEILPGVGPVLAYPCSGHCAHPRFTNGGQEEKGCPLFIWWGLTERDRSVSGVNHH